MRVREVKTAKRYIWSKTPEVSDHENSAGHMFGQLGGTHVAIGDYLIEDSHGHLEVVSREDFQKYYEIVEE